MSKRKVKSRAVKGKRIRQVGVLPYRRGAGGAIEFLLITSRTTKRFVIPKGWQMKGRTDSQAAGREAEEEAGIVGRTDTSPIGEYRYWKRLRSSFVPVTVRVFPMEVAEELSEWPERGERKRAWLKPEQAAMLVDEPSLSAMLLQAPRSIAAFPDRISDARGATAEAAA